MKKDPMKVIPLEQLQLNDGQVEWLPRNPRSFTQTDIDRTKASLDEDADFLQERPLLAIPGPDKNFVVFAGNLRLTAARELGWPGAPVVVYRPEGISKEDRDTIKRRALKDNGSFGSWDTDALANDWDADPWQLEQWGVPEWITGEAPKEGSSAPNPKEGKAAELVDLKVSLAPEEFAFVKRTLGEAADNDRDALLLLLGYNPDGEADVL